MTRIQALWAKQHDWCTETAWRSFGEYAVTVRCDVGEQPDFIQYDYETDQHMPVRMFTDCQALRAWAGY